MKKTIKTLVLAIVMLSGVEAFAQTFPYGINYQAVARDANGNAKQNQQVPVQFTIYQHSTSGTMVYQERQVLTTNAMGQFTAVIGNGAPVTPYNTSSFSQLNWGADSTFLKVEINSNTSFTGTFSQVGNTAKFQAVPYALYSVSTKLKVPTIQRFTSGSGTYTTPAGVLYIEVEMIGGGGGSGNAGSNGSSGGGGSGGYLKFLMNTPLTSYSYSVGVGGTAAAVGSGTMFNSNIAGGGQYSSSTSSDGSPGGAGGTNTFLNGTLLINMSGNAGGIGAPTNSVGGPIGAAGGAGVFGGAPQGNTNAGVSAAANSGAGGGGAASNLGGGNGGSGIIIVKEYYQ